MWHAENIQVYLLDDVLYHGSVAALSMCLSLLMQLSSSTACPMCVDSNSMALSARYRLHRLMPRESPCSLSCTYDSGRQFSPGACCVLAPSLCHLPSYSEPACRCCQAGSSGLEVLHISISAVCIRRKVVLTRQSQKVGCCRSMSTDRL